MEAGQKRCGKCGEDKPLAAFARDRGRHDGRQTQCRSCHSTYHRGYYPSNKARYRASKNSVRARAKALIDEIKAAPCADCGCSYPPYVMDLDHLPGTGKVAAVSKLVHRHSEERVLAEAAKCEVVCANCHRIRTHERRQAAKGAIS